MTEPFLGLFHTLTRTDPFWAARVGVERRLESKRRGLRDKNCESDPEAIALANDIFGAGAELACARYLLIPWKAGVNTFKEPDVGPYQVRCGMKQWHRLKVRQDDKPDEIFISVTLKSWPTYWLQGWMTCREALEVGHQDAPRGGRPVWFVDVDQLHPMEALLESPLTKKWQTMTQRDLDPYWLAA